MCNRLVTVFNIILYLCFVKCLVFSILLLYLVRVAMTSALFQTSKYAPKPRLQSLARRFPCSKRIYPYSKLLFVTSHRQFSSNSHDSFTQFPSSISTSLSPRLIQHLHILTENALRDRFASSKKHHTWLPHISTIAKKMVSSSSTSTPSLLSMVQTNEELHHLGVSVVRSIRLISDEDLETLFPVVSSSESVMSPLEVNISQLHEKYQRYLRQNVDIYQTIASHHQKLASHQLHTQDSTNQLASQLTLPEEQLHDKVALSAYATAASHMGDKTWVKLSNHWMAKFATSFFRFGGAKKHYQKTHHLKYYDSPENATLLDTMPKDLLQMFSGNRRLKILDVGSCYNPLTQFPEAEHMDILGIDLHPATEPVFTEYSTTSTATTSIDKKVEECDFLTVKVGPIDSEIVYETYRDVNGTEKRRIVQLPSHSFDCVTMSLVLSYLPSPEQRALMIYKARLLLRDQDPLLTSSQANRSHYAGLLLIIEKASIFSHKVLPTQDMSASVSTSTGNEEEDDLDTAFLNQHQVSNYSTATKTTIEEKYQNTNSITPGRTLLGEWKYLIASLGFSLVKYSPLTRTGEVMSGTGKGKRTHAFAFCTSCSPMRKHFAYDAQYVQNTQKNDVPVGHGTIPLPLLWIRQDFLNPLTSATSAAVDEVNDKNNINNDAKTEERFLRTTAAFQVKENHQYFLKHSHVHVNSEADHHLCQIKQRRKIGVVGGGLAGVAFALAVHRGSVSGTSASSKTLLSPETTIYERDDALQSRHQGYALTIQQAHASLKHLGLAERVRDTGVASTIHYAYDAQGAPLGAYGRCEYACTDNNNNNVELPNTSGRHNIHIPRQQLRRMLYSALDDINAFGSTNNQNHIAWNKRLIGVSEDYSTVLSASSGSFPAWHTPPITLHFDDGSSDLVDVLVGADGIFSQVRRFRFGSEYYVKNSNSDDNKKDTVLKGVDSGLTYLNLMVVLGISRTESRLSRSVGDIQQKIEYEGPLCQRQWLNGATRVFTMPFDASQTMWQMSFPCSENDAIRFSTAFAHNVQDLANPQQKRFLQGQALKALALRQIAGWDPILQNIIMQTNEDQLSGHPVYDREPECILSPIKSSSETQTSREWLRPESQITLVGDAAHPMSPFKGQGANQALLDAVSLYRALRTSTLYRMSSGSRSIAQALRFYEQEMVPRNKDKIIKSRQAALFLHSSAALSKANITRAKAAEIAGQTDPNVS